MILPLAVDFSRPTGPCCLSGRRRDATEDARIPADDWAPKWSATDVREGLWAMPNSPPALGRAQSPANSPLVSCR